jgi:signal transduction histidine kinase/DNA-binding response OmpR family regulator
MSESPAARILVVEDSPTQCAALEALLQRHAFDVVATHSGEEALALLEERSFDLVLSDIIMPGISGYEVCARIRATPGLREVPVVLMTGLSDPRDIIRGLECGAANYITKPFDPDYLVARLRHVLANRELRKRSRDGAGVEVLFMSETFHVSADRETILDLCLSSYEELVRTNQAVRTAEHRSRFLAEASQVLASMLDYERAFQSLAALAVPELADLCIVDELAADGEVRRAAVVHEEPAHAGMIERLRHGPPFTVDGGHPAACAMRERRSLVVTRPQGEQSAPGNDEGFHDLVHGLGFRSCMIVPLAARDRVLGAVTFIAMQSGREYRAEDLLVAEDLARRAAMTIDNARLVDDLHRSRAAVEVQRAEAERAREEAELANRSKSEFLAMMSHELRTPLNAISGYAQLLREGVSGPVNENQQQNLQRIERNGAHLLSLINDVLNFAKLEAGRIELRLTDVPVDEVLSGVEALIRPQLQAKGLRYEYFSGSPDVTVHADQEKLLQIVLNLLTNSLKFTEAGGLIRLRWQANSEICIYVDDTGVGIAPEKLASVFEPFVQVAERYRRDNEGVGLGLAISRDLARSMGGELSAESEPGRGSSFLLRLPRRPLGVLGPE